jgi:hypothetical protein
MRRARTIERQKRRATLTCTQEQCWVVGAVDGGAGWPLRHAQAGNCEKRRFRRGKAADARRWSDDQCFPFQYFELIAEKCAGGPTTSVFLFSILN